MGFDWWTFALQAANFAVLVWLLHRFLYRPVLRIIATRKAEIEQIYRDSAAAKAEAETQRASATAERASTAAERDALLSRASVQAEEAAAARHAEAARDAAALLEDARKQIAVERAQALTEARGLAIDLATDMARRLLSDIPLALRVEGWLERVELYLAALPAEERQGLAQQLAAGAPLRVVSAWPLPEGARGLWRDRLARALQCELAVELASDPGLIAGVELHFPSAVLQLNWKSQLGALRAQDVSAEQTSHATAH